VPSFLDQQHLLAFVMSCVRLCAWLLLLTLIFVPIEHLFGLHRQKFLHKGLAQDLGYFFINGLVPGLLLAVPLSLVALGAHAVVPFRLQAAVADWPLWQRIVVGLVVGEVGFYWGHRWMHEMPFLWRFHSIHHGPEHVYFLVSSRAHPLDNAFIRLCGLVPAVILVGFLHPFKFALAPGSVGMGDRHARVSPLAPHPKRPSGPQLRVYAALD